MNNRMFFFEGSESRRLLGVYHQPAGKVRAAILFCHPFAEEKNCSHSVCVRSAVQLARAGFAVFRFDFSGCGDSEGELSQCTLTNWKNDFENALEWLRQEAGQVPTGVWGLRSGAAVCLKYSIEKKVEFAILWQPVLDLKQYMEQFLRQRIGTQMFAGSNDESYSVAGLVRQLEKKGEIEVFGYKLGRELYHDFISTGNIIPEIVLPKFVYAASISLLQNPSYSFLSSMNQLKSKNNNLHTEHIRLTPFWDRYWIWDSPQVAEKAITWLKSYY